MPARTFIAVVASPEIRQATRKVADLLRPAAGDVKWVAPENLHWTLQFLGDVDVLEIPAVCNAVACATREVDTFELEARGVGAFPAPDRPRTLWLGAGAGAIDDRAAGSHSTSARSIGLSRRSAPLTSRI